MRLSPYLICGVALVVALVLSITLGSEPIAPSDIVRVLFTPWSLDGASRDLLGSRSIILDLRLPRAALMALVGAALGGSGAAYQGLLRNPLADPYLIGVAPGAALGAAASMVSFGSTTALGFLTVPVAAFVGALVTVALVYRVSRVGRTAPVTTLILAGVAFGSFESALTSLLMLPKEKELRRVIYFLLGGFDPGGWEPVLATLPYVAAGLAVVVALARPINVLQFGDEQALQMGLDVERVKLVLILAASLAAAAAVAFVGIIGFVGLVAPHVVRLIWGTDYRRLVPLSIISGAALLLVASAVARAVPGLNQIPLGVVTALLGAPFFLYLLRREQRTVW